MLALIKDLRDIRERGAGLELHRAKAAEDRAIETAKLFESYLDQRQASRGAEEQAIYREALSGDVNLHAFDAMHQRISRLGHEMQELGAKSASFDQAAAKASATAHEARLKHVQLLRSKKKWEFLMGRSSERALADETLREDLMFEELVTRSTAR